MKKTAAALRRIWRANRLESVASLVLLVLVVASVLSKAWSVGGDPEQIVGSRLSPPSAEWPLGTDSLGRSLLARLLDGIGTSFTLSVVAVLLAGALGTVLGVAAGYAGRLFGEVVMRIVDIMYAFPALVLAILVAALLGPGTPATIASIVLVTVPLMTRMVRVATMAVVGRDFVVTARVSGVTTTTIVLRHIVPNIAGTIAVQLSYALSVAILVEGSLSFLGHGVQLPASSLGTLVEEGTVYLSTMPLLLFAPGLVLVLVILCINIIGDGLRDRFEPRVGVR